MKIEGITISKTHILEEVRAQNKTRLLGKSPSSYTSGDGFSAYVKEKHGKK